VAWPLVRALEAEGFVDALRAVHPDELGKPAYTWTPTTDPADPADHHDRIDFVLVRDAEGGPELTIEAAGIVGEKAPEADLVVTPWPSDHRAVRVVIRLD
jgi:exonuclease III